MAHVPASPASACADGSARRSSARCGASLERKVENILRHEEPKKLAAGWTKTEDGHWIPPGWVRDPGGTAPEPPGEDGPGTHRDSV